MSYGTKNMRPLDRTNPPITIAAPSTQAEFPHMLKQRNYATAGPAEFSPSHVSIKVVRHNDDVPQGPCAQIFPTLSQQSRQQVCQQESEWNKHVIVASVAGLETRLAELDSQMRTAAPDAVMGHLKDHADILRESAQHASALQSRHKDTTALTHQICSTMNDTLEAHARTLQQHKQQAAGLADRQGATGALTHEICSKINDTLAAHAQTLQQHGRKQSSTAALTHEICSHINSTLEAHAGSLEQHGRKQSAAAALTHEICSRINDTLEAHAGTLEQHAGRHRTTAALTHEICSHINSTLEAHAGTLEQHAQQAAGLADRHGATAALTHEICSHINRTLEAHAGTLEQHTQQAAGLADRHRSAAALTHEICSHINSTLEAHALTLQQHAQQAAGLADRHGATANLTHEICSHINSTLEAHALTLEQHGRKAAGLADSHSSAAALTHEICSHLNQTMQGHALESQSLQGSVQEQASQISRLQQKEAVAQTLLTRMLTMLGQHDTKLQDGTSAEHLALLDAMCESFDKTKSKVQTFENTQKDMLKTIAEFQSGKLPGAATHDMQAMHTRLDKYQRMSQDMDAQFSQALSGQQSKIQDLEHRLTASQQLSSHGQQGKIRDLEARVQQLSLQHLNSSQDASIIRGTDRDVKHLQHEIRQLHALRQDVDGIKTLKDSHADLTRDVQSIKSHVSGIADTQRNYARTDAPEINSKLQDLRRDMMLQDVRLDKAHMNLADMRKKMEA
jgi:hypothetical protein